MVAKAPVDLALRGIGSLREAALKPVLQEAEVGLDDVKRGTVDSGGAFFVELNEALEVVLDGDLAVPGADEHGAFFAFAGAQDDFTASGLDQHLASSDVPEADLFFNIGVETTAGDVGHGKRGATEHAGLAHFIGDFLVALKAGVEGFLGFGEADGDNGLVHGGATADLDGFAIERGGDTLGHLPKFILHGIINDADEELICTATTCGDGNAEVGDAEEIVHRAINRVDDPFDVAVATDVGIAFFSEDEVIGMPSEDELGDEILAAHVHLQFDVVPFHLVHGEV
jgi:hypothetical protein